MTPERITSSQCSNVEITEEVIRTKADAKDQPPYVVALSLTCPFRDTENNRCLLTNRFRREAKTSVMKASLDAMRRVDREIADNCLEKKQKNVAS